MIRLAERYGRFVLPVLVIVAGTVLLRDYFFPRLQVMLALLAAPFVFRANPQAGYSNRYFYVSVALIALYALLAMKLFLFLGLGTTFLYCIESRFGKTGPLPFFFLVALSPALHYAVNAFTFSLRLMLSSHAAHALNLAGLDVSCNGNFFTLADGFVFNVDKACLGLNMYGSGLALAVLLIGLRERTANRQLRFAAIVLVMIVAAALLVSANFFRIIVIVLLRAMPGTLAHELTGILAMIAYVAVPVFFFIRFIVKRYGKARANGEFSPPGPVSRLAFPIVTGLMVWLAHNVVVKEENAQADPLLAKLEIPGFTRVLKEDGVAEFRSPSLLVYIKPPVRPFQSDHPPALCWKAAGFDVEQVSEEIICGNKVLMAVLKKDSAVQYTAWWYDNGKVKTTDQWVWRLSRGEAFRIVNLTAANKDFLVKECGRFAAMKLF
jgi:exosortase N